MPSAHWKAGQVCLSAHVSHLRANVDELHIVLQKLEDRVEVGQVLDAHLAALQLSHLVACGG